MANEINPVDVQDPEDVKFEFKAYVTVKDRTGKDVEIEDKLKTKRISLRELKAEKDYLQAKLVDVQSKIDLIKNSK